MRNANPGFERRFPLSSALTFDDFSDDELAAVLLQKAGDMTIDIDSIDAAVEVLSRERRANNHFGNGAHMPFDPLPELVLT